MGLHKFNQNHEQRKLWFKQNKNKITKIATITMSVIVFVVGVILLTRADFNSLFDLDMISTKVGNTCEYEVGHVFEFDYNGTDGTDGSEQLFIAPCNGTYKIEAWGASGTGDVGKGGYTKGEIELSREQQLYVYVGGENDTSIEYVIGGYNGGGYGTHYNDNVSRSYPGGGATDIRIVNGSWNDFSSLKSRIMVAAGGAGLNNDARLSSAYPGSGGGLIGASASGSLYSVYPHPTGGTQTSTGVGENEYYNGSFGMALQTSPSNCWGSGGGGGYYGGVYGCGAHGSGGSSFISGYSGCNAISQSSTSTNIVHTNQANHYSGYVFTNTVMIDGNGCDWSTGSAINCGANQVQPDGTNAVGHTGNGYARISLLSTNEEVVTPTVELYDGMVPVTYDNNGNTLVADTSTEWYSYGGHKWANAVLVSNTSTYLDSNNNVLTNKKGTVIPTSDILQYYVWIPRFKYKLFNANNGSVDEQMIEIKFQNKDNTKFNGNQNGQWLTHPAFTFGDTELNGFWVAKFEPSVSTGTLSCTDENCDVSNLRIIPNVSSIRSLKVGNQFYSTRSIEKYYGLNSSQVDSHMMKNMEWGAVAYLSASKYGLYINNNICANSKNNITISLKDSTTANRCNIWTNPNVNYKTGCSGSTMDDRAISDCNEWNSPQNNGVSSTTGNLYGIYDMSGGSWEFVMGNAATGVDTYSYQAGLSELNDPGYKYYDTYVNNYNTHDGDSHSIGKLGDATSETIKTFGSSTGGWFSDYELFPANTFVWFGRGGAQSYGANTGIFYVDCNPGGAVGGTTFRPVITKD